GEVNALAHGMNEALWNVGRTVYYTEPVDANPVNHWDSLEELAADIHKDKVDLLLILGGNPVYDAPRDWAFSVFEQKLKKVHTIVHVSSHYNETSEFSHWHIPETHFLESWGDARAYDGTYSVIQPLIAPLYQAHSALDVRAALPAKPGVNSAAEGGAAVKPFWGAGAEEKKGDRGLTVGAFPGTALPPLSVSAKVNAADLPAPKASARNELEFIFRP